RGGAAAQLHALGQGRTRGGVVRRHHRIVLWQAPLGPVVVGAHVVLSAQVALQRLVLLAVFQADQVVGRDRLLDRHGRLLRLGRRGDRGADAGQGAVDGLDHRRDVRSLDGVVRDVGGGNVRRQGQKLCVVFHVGPPQGLRPSNTEVSTRQVYICKKM